MYDFNNINNVLQNPNSEFLNDFFSSIHKLDINNKIIDEEQIFNGSDSNLNNYKMEFHPEKISDLIFLIEAINKKVLLLLF